MTQFLVGVGSALVVGLIALLWQRGQHREGSGSGRNTVAAVPESAPRRLADIVQDVEVLQAEMEGLQRRWVDFAKSWERRWGTLTRADRRDAAAAAAEAAAGAPDSQDDAQLSFAAPPAPEPAQRRPLRPARILRRVGE